MAVVYVIKEIKSAYKHISNKSKNAILTTTAVFCFHLSAEELKSSGWWSCSHVNPVNPQVLVVEWSCWFHWEPWHSTGLNAPALRLTHPFVFCVFTPEINDDEMDGREQKSSCQISQRVQQMVLPAFTLHAPHRKQMDAPLSTRFCELAFILLFHEIFLCG